MNRSLALPLLLACGCLVSVALAQVFAPDAWLVRERLDAQTGADTSLAVLGAADDPRGNDGAIALRCSPTSADGVQAFIDFDAVHGNEGVFEVQARWGDEPARTLALATSAGLDAGFVLSADTPGFVADLRRYDRLEVALIDVDGAAFSYLWELPDDSSALVRLACLP